MQCSLRAACLPPSYYLFFSGEREQQRRFFKELHFISIAILTFGLACWVVTFNLTLPRAFNDVHGHDVGDKVPKRIAEVIAGLPGEHLCGRLGGEEFAVIYQGEKNAACAFAAQLVDAVEAAFGPEHNVSISIGVAELIREVDLSQSYRRADESLYLAKKNGKNRYVLNAA